MNQFNFFKIRYFFIITADYTVGTYGVYSKIQKKKLINF